MKRQPVDKMLSASAEVHGHVERFEGGQLVGWAAPADWGSHSEIRVVTAAGTEIATGLADQERADLASLGRGRCDLAFRIPVSNFGSHGALHVFADGTALPGSPIAVGAGVFDGYVSVAGDVVSGWVSERCDGASAPEVEVVDHDGVIVCVLQSAFPVAEEGTGQIARFSGLLHQRCFLRPDTILTARVDRKPFAQATANLAIIGHLDHLDTGRVTGWLHSPQSPARLFDVEVFRNGVSVARARTGLAREDVRAAHPGAGRAGFDIVLPDAAGQGAGASVVSIRLDGSDQDILGGPRLVGGQAAIVEAARRAVRTTLFAHPDRDPGSDAVLRLALARLVTDARDHAPEASSCLPAQYASARVSWRMTVIIPCYADAAVTRDCIVSVLAVRHPAEIRLILINDASPDPAMAAMLDSFAQLANVFVITNAQNLGFIGTVNRGLLMCGGGGDVLLLNSDTVMFPGALDGLYQALHSAPDIGTATAMSNTATIFSYPHEQMQCQHLDDIAWDEVAALARTENHGLTIEVPTGHGFCMLIRENVLRGVGLLDTGFGRGYGEENDYCARASDLGYRHVLAADVFVQHREGVSFGAEKAALVNANLARLGRRYPEYTALIMAFIGREGLRKARWAVDRRRIRAMVDAGQGFVLVVNHGLGGGTGKAVRDIEAAIGYDGAIKLSLTCLPSGAMDMSCATPPLRASFAADEAGALFDLLERAGVASVVVHSVLGFSAEFVRALGVWAAGRRSTFYAHDFYPICPRVTMIDASDRFCDIATPDVCNRCIEQAGAHEQSRLGSLPVRGHRELFRETLGSFSTLIAPSNSAASYFRRCFPQLVVTDQPHPEAAGAAVEPRKAGAKEVVLFGAIGPHKGSKQLLALARRATLTAPDLIFRVIGHTDIDEQLLAMGNVIITGRYEPERVAELASQARGRAALFLHRWPETYSYTLSEAVQLGFVPIVPDIGAPAERVRASGVGVVFRMDLDPDELLRLTLSVLEGHAPAAESPARPPVIGAARYTLRPVNNAAQRPRVGALGHAAGSLA